MAIVQAIGAAGWVFEAAVLAALSFPRLAGVLATVLGSQAA